MSNLHIETFIEILREEEIVHKLMVIMFLVGWRLSSTVQSPDFILLAVTVPKGQFMCCSTFLHLLCDWYTRFIDFGIMEAFFNLSIINLFLYNKIKIIPTLNSCSGKLAFFSRHSQLWFGFYHFYTVGCTKSKLPVVQGRTQHTECLQFDGSVLGFSIKFQSPMLHKIKAAL